MNCMFPEKEIRSDQLDLHTFFFHQEFHENYRIKHAITDMSWGNRLHTHNFYEILLCWTDDFYFLVNDRVYRLNQRDLLLFNNRDIHGVIFNESTKFDRYVIEFDPNYTQDMCKFFDLLSCFEQVQKTSLISLNSEQADQFMSLFQKLLNLETNESAFARPLQQKLAFTELLALVNSFAANKSGDGCKLEDNNIMRIQKVITYIKDHLSENITLPELANLVYLSPSYFSLLFKQHVGYSATQYIINQRIQYAAELLRQNYPVQYVVDHCGFSDYAHFIRTFKKYMGISPGQYRNSFTNKTLLSDNN